ncbi:LapA family protein [Ligilactobacillus hohenheimensis]|uniref:LapA family protein n=1 Tax=Ligilactobacillus hohenheimensis TaxID=2991832 RepID=UPI0024B91047|nr:LapA family protein [Ligilactobacillus hohenheimensis]
MKRQLKLIGAVVLALIVVIFAMANFQQVTVYFLFGTVRLPLVVIIVGALLIGMVITFMGAVPTILRLKTQNKRMSKKQASQQTDK